MFLFTEKKAHFYFFLTSGVSLIKGSKIRYNYNLVGEKRFKRLF